MFQETRLKLCLHRTHGVSTRPLFVFLHRWLSGSVMTVGHNSFGSTKQLLYTCEVEENGGDASLSSAKPLDQQDELVGKVKTQHLSFLTTIPEVP